MLLAHNLHFDPARGDALFASIPAAPAVFLLRGHDGAGEPYVSKTANLRRRLLRLLGAPEERSKRLNLRERVGEIAYSLTGSDFESGFLLYKVLRSEFPKTYAKRLHLRPAPLIRYILENEYPRVSVTARITTLRGRSLYYGPFPTRAAAEKFSNDALDFFKLRRCTDDLHPDPAFPGCMYSEMKMCLAPCFKGCTGDEYRLEAERVQAFFDTGGHSLKRELETERDRASADLDFERAASLHARIEKLAPVLAQVPEIVSRLDRLGGVIVQPSAEKDAVSLFRIEAGRLNGPIMLKVQQNPAELGTQSGDPAVSRPPQESGSPPAVILSEAPEARSEGPMHSRPHHEAPSQESANVSQSRPSAAKPRPLSMEARITEALAPVPPLEPATAQETMEQLAYLKRWYYRTSKTGEAFFTDDKGELPLRRIVRGVSRVFRGEKYTGELNETTRDYWLNRGKAAVLNPDNYNV
jgi:excinuclease ABC subunit C